MVSKDCCANCSYLKTKEIQKIKYGNENYGVEKALNKFKEHNKRQKAQGLNRLLQKAHDQNIIIFPMVYDNVHQEISYLCSEHLEYGVQKKSIWNFIESQYNCHWCLNEHKTDVFAYTYDDAKSIIEASGENVLISTEYINAHEKLEVLCSLCKKETYFVSLNKYQTNNQKICKSCYQKSLYGETSNRWNGGYSHIYSYLRSCINTWRDDSFHAANYTCDISGTRGSKLVVHHAYKTFRNIVKETFEIAKIPLRTKLEEYTYEEQILLKKICIELHYKYGLGICLSERYHSMFHSIYGKIDTTFEQYLEFKNFIQNNYCDIKNVAI